MRSDQLSDTAVPTKGERLHGNQPDLPYPGFLQRLADWFFGYDYFLAHRSGDGKPYAIGLYEALTAKGNELSCFLDVKHYSAGRDLTYLQSAALHRTTRLIVVVTPLAHARSTKELPNHLLNEVREFMRLHPIGAIVPVGTVETLSKSLNQGSELLALIPHYPNSICIIESAEALATGVPSATSTAKLLNDFTEERHSTLRLRWMRRVALLLVALLALAAWQWTRADRAGRQANEKLAEVNWQLGQQARGPSLSLHEVSPVTATWHLLEAAKAAARAGDQAASDDAVRAALAASSHLQATMIHPADELWFEVAAGDKRALTWTAKGEVWLWDAETGVLLAKLPPQPAGLHRAAFSRSGRRILALDNSGVARVWNAENAESVGLPMPHKERVDKGIFSRDDAYLLTWSSWNGQVQSLDMERHHG